MYGHQGTIPSLRRSRAEDEELIRVAIGLLVQGLEGIELVSLAADGQEALELSRKFSPICS